MSAVIKMTQKSGKTLFQRRAMTSTTIDDFKTEELEIEFESNNLDKIEIPNFDKQLDDGHSTKVMRRSTNVKDIYTVFVSLKMASTQWFHYRQTT